MSTEDILNEILQNSRMDTSEIMDTLGDMDSKIDTVMSNTDPSQKFNELYTSNKSAFNIRYSQLLSLHQQLEQNALTNGTVVDLYQTDFVDGTYLITQPGYYRLAEDIVFNPNSRWAYSGGGRTDTGLDWFPTSDQLKPNGPYDTKAFRFGFFAAVVITANNVVFDLNGYTLSQAKEHALQQGFFSLIELSSAPFPRDAGPAMFADTIFPGKNVTIKNGTLGMNSHHGIHGNDASNVIIENVTFIDFTVAAISLNNTSNLLVKNVLIDGNRKDTPVMGTYTTARFIRLFMERVIASQSGSVKTDGENKLAALNAALDAAFDEIIGTDGVSGTGITTNPLFKNEARVLDANVFAILIHGQFSVLEFADSDINTTANDICLQDVTIRNVQNNIHEITALTDNVAKDPMVGPAGQVFDIVNVTGPTGTYQGTVITDCQLYVAEHGVGQAQRGRASINQAIIDWANNGTDLADVLTANPSIEYICNGDRMHHVNKGTLGMKLDGCNRVTIENCSVKNIDNDSVMGSEFCGPYDVSHQGQEIPYGASQGNCRGVSLAYCRDVCVKGLDVDDVHSNNGEATGLDIFNGSRRVEGKDIHISDITAGTFTVQNGLKIWEGEAFEGGTVAYNANLPNTVPRHRTVHVGSDCQNINLYDVTIGGDNYSPSVTSGMQLDLGVTSIHA